MIKKRLKVVLLVQCCLIVFWAQDAFSNRIDCQTRGYGGSVNYMDIQGALDLTFWSVWGVFVLVPEYTVEFHEHNSTRHGLLWEAPFGIIAGPTMTVLSPSVYYFPVDGTVGGTVMYRVQVFPLMDTIEWHRFHFQVGGGYFYDSTGHGPRCEFRVLFGAGNDHSTGGFFCSYSYGRDIDNDEDRHLVSAGIEYFMVLNGSD